MTLISQGFLVKNSLHELTAISAALSDGYL